MSETHNNMSAIAKHLNTIRRGRLLFVHFVQSIFSSNAESPRLPQRFHLRSLFLLVHLDLLLVGSSRRLCVFEEEGEYVGDLNVGFPDL